MMPCYMHVDCDLCRIGEEAQNAELAQLRAKCDTLAAENRAMREAMKSVHDSHCVFHPEFHSGDDCMVDMGKLWRVLHSAPHTAREVERVQVLEKVAQRFAALNAEYHHFEDGQSIPPEPWVEMEWTLGAKALIALDKKGGK